MKKLKRFIIWLSTIVCGFMLWGMLIIFSFDILSIGMLLGFTYWFILLINKLCFKRNKFFEWINKRNWLFLFGFLIIFTASSLVVENTTTTKTENTHNIISSEEQVNSNTHVCDYEFKTKISSTCQKNGKEIFKCKCGKEKVNKINKTKCDYDLIKDKKPDFTSNGEKQYKCKWCKKLKSKTYGKIKAPITFTMIDYDIDFLGGVTHTVKIKNNTNKQIKYIHYSLYYTNAVGDIIYSDLQFNKSPITWTITGPIASTKSITFSGYGFYNNNVRSYILSQLEIEYMDGTVQTIFAKDLTDYEVIVY